MRALQLVTPGRWLEEREWATPEPGWGEIVVEVRAAGICRSDVHYRSGFPVAGPLPLTLGHEISGVVVGVGPGASSVLGSRVCVHYLVSCGKCHYCAAGSEQFCVDGAMLGMQRDGGYADLVVIPERNAFGLPGEISFEHAAVMMCSSATCYHALLKARIRPTETVAAFGVGGLGMSAIQIAQAFGASMVFGVDINESKLALAEGLGAVPIDAANQDAVGQVMEATGGRGVDIALELIGLSETMRQAVAVLAPMGRAVAVGVGPNPIEMYPYRDLIKREAEVIGSADHLAQEIPGLLELGRRGALDLSDVVTDTIPLEATAINEAMDELAKFGDGVRTVIVPG